MSTEKKRVLEVFGEPISNGGQESFVMNVFTHIDHARFAIDLLTPYDCDNEYYRELVEAQGGAIYTFGLAFEPGKSRFNINEKIDAFYKEHHYDVVHIHSGSISVLMIMSKYARKNGVQKVIVHSHCAAEKKTLKYRLTKAAASPSICRYPTDFCACSLVAGEWKYPDRIVKNRLRVIKNGVDLQKYAFSPEVRARMRTKTGISGEAFVLGHVGRFSYQKNHEYLVDVFADVKKQDKNAVLMLIGSGETMPEVKRRAKELQVADSVIFVGNVPNVNEYMQAMDVFVLPSRYEGLPLVGVEAQAAGLPVITSTNVSQELRISDAVTFLSLEDGAARWAQEVLTKKNQKRRDYSGQIRANGYDIEMTAEEIESLYLS